MLVINRKTLRECHVPDAKILGKADIPENDPGSISGYLAVFGNVDQSGEIIQKGSFARTINAKFGNGGTIPLMIKHFASGGDTKQCVGSIVSAKEDDFGLWIEATFDLCEAAQDTRGKIARKHVKGLSVGFFPVAYEMRPPANDDEKAALEKSQLGQKDPRDEILIWKECELAEGTITVRPCNVEAQIMNVKALPDDDECPHCKQKKIVAPLATAKAAPVDTAKAPVNTATPAPVQTAKAKAAEYARRLKLLTA